MEHEHHKHHGQHGHHTTGTGVDTPGETTMEKIKKHLPGAACSHAYPTCAWDLLRGNNLLCTHLSTSGYYLQLVQDAPR